MTRADAAPDRLRALSVSLRSRMLSIAIAAVLANVTSASTVSCVIGVWVNVVWSSVRKGPAARSGWQAMVLGSWL